MVRKTATAAAIAAGMIFTIVNVEGSGAVAQDVLPTLQKTTESPDEEVVPVFVPSETVQPLPDEAAQVQDPGDAASLHELVSDYSPGPLSGELQCLAGAIYFESRGEPLDGQLAVAQVVVNRAESSLFPSSYCGVVRQRAQFSFVKNGRIPQARTDSAAWRKAQAIARIAHEGLWESEAADSLYFHASYVRPSWSRKKIARATIDSHIFYK